MVATGGEAREEVMKISNKHQCIIYGNNAMSAQNIGGVALVGVGTNGASPRKGCAVNGQTTEASNKRVRPPPPRRRRLLPTLVAKYRIERIFLSAHQLQKQKKEGSQDPTNNVIEREPSKK